VIVVNKDILNAFCLPGGKIVVFTGLIKHFPNDAEIATVLGHEVRLKLSFSWATEMLLAVARWWGLVLLLACCECLILECIYDVLFDLLVVEIGFQTDVILDFKATVY
jgi:hypothetical protein